MPYLQISMRLFMFLQMILSIPMIFMSYSLNDNLDDCLKNESAKAAARGLLIMSVSIFVMTFVFLVLSFICDCSNISNLDNGWVGVAMVIFSFILGIIVLSLTIMVKNSCSDVSEHANGILGLSIAIISVSILYMGYRMYEIYNNINIVYKNPYQPKGIMNQYPNKLSPEGIEMTNMKPQQIPLYSKPKKPQRNVIDTSMVFSGVKSAF